MAKQPNDDMDVIEKAGTPAPLSTEMLLKMLIDTQKQLAESQNAMAAALLESRKPYVDPKVLEQKQLALEERRKQINVEYRQRVATKKICPHKRENGTYNIKWMEHSNHITTGVCGTCRSEFDTRNQDDLKLLRDDLKSIKNMGRSGAHAMRGILVEA
ncbi:MAG: hypothetical protein ACYDHE_11245 [Candidatus Acidiferrales bacterium]